MPCNTRRSRVLVPGELIPLLLCVVQHMFCCEPLPNPLCSVRPQVQTCCLTCSLPDIVLFIVRCHGQDTTAETDFDNPLVAIVRQAIADHIRIWNAQQNVAVATQPTFNAANCFSLNYWLGGCTSVVEDTLPGSNPPQTQAPLSAFARNSLSSI